jgi:hypothetical protein
MLTWIRLWVICPAPFVPLFLVGCFPSFELMGKTVHGGIIRQTFVNYVALPVMPQDWAVQLVAWFEQANYFQELLLHLIISVDLTLVLLPLMFLIGQVLISVSAWASTTDHSLKTKQVRQ